MSDYEVTFFVSYSVSADSMEDARKIAFEKHKNKLRNNSIYCWCSIVEEREGVKKDGQGIDV